MPSNNSEQEDGVDKIDSAQAFLGGISAFGNGIPLFCAAVIGGYLLGEGDSVLDAISMAWFDLFERGSAFIALPVLITCFLLLLFSEIPKVSVVAITFVTSAWSAWTDNENTIRGVAIFVVATVLYVLCIHPLVIDYRQRNR